MKPLSHSSVSLYLECPLRYKFKYLEGIPEEPRHYFSFGKSMHSALEFLYDVRFPPPPGLPEVLNVYKAKWIHEGYKNPDQEAQYFREGERMLREYYSRNMPKFRPPLFCEYRFRVEIGGAPVIGFVDRIDKTEKGGLAIVDYKTGGAFDLERVRKDPQMTLYQMACKRGSGDGGGISHTVSFALEHAFYRGIPFAGSGRRGKR